MSSVTDIVNVISYVLVAFVGISLVVSSIMIGVITVSYTHLDVYKRQSERTLNTEQERIKHKVN